MKHFASILLCLGQIAATGQALSVSRDKIKTECFRLDNVDEQESLFNSYGSCANTCASAGAGRTVFALRGEACACFASLPSDDSKVDASECNEPCPGYPEDICGGGREYYSVAVVEESYFDSSNTTDTTATLTATSTSTSVTGTVLPSSVPTNSTSSVTAPSSSAQGGSASASPSIESTNAATPAFGSSVTAIFAIVYAMVVVGALI